MKTSLIITISIIIAIVGVGIWGFMLLTSSNSSQTPQNAVSAIIDDKGNQVIEMKAKGGYSPSIMTAQAGKPILLKVITNNTYDCSSTLYIPQIKYSKNLPVNGTAEIQIPAQKVGDIDITCSMGMYKAKLKIV